MKQKVFDKTCPYCHKEFRQIKGRVFSNHVRWCEENPRHNEICGKKLRSKINATLKQKKINLHGVLKKFTVKCEKCGNEFQVEEPENDFPIKARYFCSSFCSHSYSSGYVDTSKISVGMKRYCTEHGMVLSKKETRTCRWCGEDFETTNIRDAKCCCLSCASKYRQFRKYEEALNAAPSDEQRIKLEFRWYKFKAAFKFSLQQFSDEFDFQLIRKVGWYKAKNHGDNPGGVSRDHMYSVYDGYVNKIDPRILAHPANCRIILQSKNSSKNKKSCITYEELIEKIHVWENKYGQYYPDFKI